MWEKLAFLLESEPAKETAKAACLSIREILDYAGSIHPVYFWEISDMIDYCSTEGYSVRNISEFGLKWPPQSWQYVKEWT